MRIVSTIRRQWIGVLGLLLGLTGVALGATGQPVLLGRANSANKPTTIQNTAGPAVRFRAPTSQPPFTVNSSKLVSGLNAAKLGGKSANAFAPASGSSNYVGAGTLGLLVPAGDKTVATTLDIFKEKLAPPANGTITLRAWADCSSNTGGGHFELLIGVGQFNSAPVTTSGLCEATYSRAVVEGVAVDLQATVVRENGTVSLTGLAGSIEFVPGAAPPRVIKISMIDNDFDPAEVTASPGESLVFELTNDGLAVHNFVIAGGPKSGFLSGGQSESVAYTMGNADVQFSCELHLPGMTGTIKVQ